MHLSTRVQPVLRDGKRIRRDVIGSPSQPSASTAAGGVQDCGTGVEDAETLSCQPVRGQNTRAWGGRTRSHHANMIRANNGGQPKHMHSNPSIRSTPHSRRVVSAREEQGWRSGEAQPHCWERGEGRACNCPYSPFLRSHTKLNIIDGASSTKNKRIRRR
jgi:hypothetical protein